MLICFLMRISFNTEPGGVFFCYRTCLFTRFFWISVLLCITCFQEFFSFSASSFRFFMPNQTTGLSNESWFDDISSLMNFFEVPCGQWTKYVLTSMQRVHIFHQSLWSKRVRVFMISDIET